MQGQVLPSAVVIEAAPARQFAQFVVDEHQKCLDSRDEFEVPGYIPRAEAMLFGTWDDSKITISAIDFIENVRGTDSAIIAEFESQLAPKFGKVFLNKERGYWFDEREVLRAIRKRSREGLNPVGSVHSHPNWHEIGPPSERGAELSENPTRLDEYLFEELGWPVNIIWYVRAGGERWKHKVASWRPEGGETVRLSTEIADFVLREFNVEIPA